MTNFKDWICDNELQVYEEFKKKYGNQIKVDYNIKFKDSYPLFEDFIDNEFDYITDTLLQDEWMAFVNEEHVSSISSEADALFDAYKDSIVTGYK